MPQDIRDILLRTFGLLSKASARKKIYARKAGREGRLEISHLLRVISESESVQARRLFNSLKGQIDISDQYIKTIFEKELEEIIAEYSQDLSKSQQEGNKIIIQVLSQLRAAERRIRSFYSKEAKDVKVTGSQRYFVCQFCGYVSTEQPPEACPICGALKKGFLEIP